MTDSTTTIMKAWSENEWITISSTGYTPDEDGYCNCFTCQYQKRIQALKVPEELFEL